MKKLECLQFNKKITEKKATLFSNFLHLNLLMILTILSIDITNIYFIFEKKHLNIFI